MGFGLPAAIGAQLANPDKIVLLVDGDGSFNMTSNDLGTVREHQLPIKIVSINDLAVLVRSFGIAVGCQSVLHALGSVGRCPLLVSVATMPAIAHY